MLSEKSDIMQYLLMLRKVVKISPCGNIKKVNFLGAIHMDTENKIKEAEIEPAKAGESDVSRRFNSIKKKISSEMVMILLIGILFGIAVKTEMSKRINIADKTFYGKQSFDFAQIQKNLEEKQKTQESSPETLPSEGDSAQPAN
jgi:hypothetical protein